MSDKRPLLVLQMQRMGDLILSYPLMLWLKRRYPDHPIYMVAEPMFYEPLMRLSPTATYCSWKHVSRLQAFDYELTVNLSIQRRAGRMANKARSLRTVGAEVDDQGASTVHGDWQLLRTSLVRNNLYNRFHWADLNGLDVIPYQDIKGTRFPPPREAGPDNNKVGIFLGASEKAKRPTPKFWADLVVQLLKRGMRPVLFGGPREKNFGQAVVDLCQSPILDLSGRLSLEELTSVGQTLALFITPDTGPMHLASWTGVKCLNLSMGNVNPWETGPYTPGHFVLRADMECARGCWHCTRSRLFCHDPFSTTRIAVLASRLVAGDSPDKLASMHLPGLAFYRTGRKDGLYHLRRLDTPEPDEERRVSLFWQSYFGQQFSLWGPTRATRAWQEVATHAPQAAETLLRHLPEMGKQFTHGLRRGGLLDETFWEASPAIVRPLTGYLHMLLENENYAPAAWKKALTHLEVLSSLTA